MRNRLVPLSGILFVVIAVLAIFVIGGSTPGVDATPAKVTSFYTAHYGRQSMAPFVLEIGALFLALFGASLWQALTERTSDVRGRLAGATVLIGAGVAVVGYLVAASLHLALAEAVHHGIAGPGAQALNSLDAEDFQGFSIGTAIMLLGAAPLMIRRTGMFRWLGWLALVVGIVSFTPMGFFGFVGANLWIVATSIALAVRSDVPATGAAMAMA